MVDQNKRVMIMKNKIMTKEESFSFSDYINILNESGSSDVVKEASKQKKKKRKSEFESEPVLTNSISQGNF